MSHLGINLSQYAEHYFRIEAATTAAAHAGGSVISHSNVRLICGRAFCARYEFVVTVCISLWQILWSSPLVADITRMCPATAPEPIKAAYKKHEDEKKRAYGQRIRDIEQGVFAPLVFSTTGGLGQEATTFYKRLADMLAWKEGKNYSVVISWLRCKLSFAAVRSSIMCIRGTRSTTHRPLRDADIQL